METQSYSAWLWLEWIALKENKEICHALNYSEVKLGKYKVDGFDGSTIYEFMGCSYHGCKKCFEDRNCCLPNELTALQAYKRMQEKREYLKRLGYRYREIWECETRKIRYFGRLFGNPVNSQTDVYAWRRFASSEEASSSPQI